MSVTSKIRPPTSLSQTRLVDAAPITSRGSVGYRPVHRRSRRDHRSTLHGHYIMWSDGSGTSFNAERLKTTYKARRRVRLSHRSPSGSGSYEGKYRPPPVFRGL